MERAGVSDYDVVVLGDGPAGTAAASACHRAGLRTLLVGPGEEWTNTYGAWVDELVDVPGLPAVAELFEHRLPRVRAAGRRGELLVERAYGVLDGVALWTALLADVDVAYGHGEIIAESGEGARDDTGSVTLRLPDGSTCAAGWVVDATGAAGAQGVGAQPPAWQTAYGVFVDAEIAAEVADLDAVTLMDWGWTEPDDGLGPTFGYVVPVGDGWLVEHTVLAAEPAVAPEQLRVGLVRRLGAEAVADAEAGGWVERVVIPMGLPPVVGDGRVIAFGMAAGMGHPATGYSVSAALRAAPRLAAALVAGENPHDAVWPDSARRARVFHDYGLAALLRLDGEQTAAFFSTFFELPVERWAPYLRVDTAPGEVSAVMLDVFRRVPWSVRRRLASGDVGGLVRLLRGSA